MPNCHKAVIISVLALARIQPDFLHEASQRMTTAYPMLFPNQSDHRPKTVQSCIIPPYCCAKTRDLCLTVPLSYARRNRYG